MESQSVFKIILDYSMYIFLIIFGILGNLLILKITVLKWKIQTGFNLFITCVAICDITKTLLNISLTINYKLGDYSVWKNGLLVCQASQFLIDFTQLLICLPLLAAPFVLQFKRGIEPSAIVIGVTVIISALISLVKPFCMKNDDKVFDQCYFESLPSDILDDINVYITFILPLKCLIISTILRFATKRSFSYCNLILSMIFINAITLGSSSIYGHHKNWPFFVEKNLASTLRNINDIFFMIYLAYKIFLYYFLHEGFHKEIKNIFKRNNVQRDEIPSQLVCYQLDKNVSNIENSKN